MQQAKAGDFHRASLTLTDHNPFPAVVGHVCHRPCEAACDRGGYDEPLAVRSLERYIGDLRSPNAGASRSRRSARSASR